LDDAALPVDLYFWGGFRTAGFQDDRVSRKKKEI
jgi:hypothetical protein